MTCNAQTLQETISRYAGGSDTRYRHTFNRRFIYSAGVQAVAELAGAYWLVDMIALQMAPVYAKAWLAGKAGLGIVKVKVPPKGSEEQATVSLSLQDDEPAAITEKLSFTTFPEGEWTFYLGTDDQGNEDYITNMYLPVEH